MTDSATPLLLTHCALANCSRDWTGDTTLSSITIEDGKISWIGKHLETPPNVKKFYEINLQGRLVTPGLIDCHTHIIYAGDRSEEHALRLAGASYEALALAGGGILSTVNATRDVSEEALFQQSSHRLQQWLNSGFTSIEIKSGYGLDFDSEIKMLKVAKRLAESQHIDVHPTLLAAHTIPPEYIDNGDGYIDWIIQTLLPTVDENNLATAVDVFCESIGFTLSQSQQLLQAAQQLGLNLKIHAEQLSNMNGAMMAANLNALSADHLEYLDTLGINAMQQASTVAVLLPVAYYFLKETQMPPIQAIKDANINIAIASDANPGSAPVCSPLLTMNMATTVFGLTTAEALKGITIHAARALGVEKLVGSIEVGKRADIAIWNLKRAEQLSYWIGGAPLYKRIYRGKMLN